jgi:nitroimidazol reductase NimA-like FMN-containing flavoprotein (pyridoxamine 5'-phosphate oxidase superfamily)
VRLTRDVADFIRRERVCRVATADGRGRPHVVPVCHVFESGRLYFGSGKGAGKILNLAANPRVAVVVDLYTDAWNHLRGVMVQGTAKFIGRGPRFRRARKGLYAKFPQYPTDAALDERDSVIVEVTPTHVYHWGFE